jgi:hypothetical protein
LAESRQPRFVAFTPYSGAQRVVCYEDAWKGKFVPNQRVPADATVVVKSLEAPTAVCLGTTNPTYFAFVNQSETSATSNNPFVVFVDPSANPMPTVVSMGYRRDFSDLSKHTVLWLPGKN